MLISEAPWRNLDPTPLTFGEQDGVLVKDTEDVPPVLAVEVVPQAVPYPQGTQASGKGAGSLICALQKTDVKDLRDVFRLNYRKPNPVNFRLRPMHTPSMRHHQPLGKFYSAV